MLPEWRPDPDPGITFIAAFFIVVIILTIWLT